MPRGLYIGDDSQAKRSVFIGEHLRNAHMHIIGRSDTGKTSHLLHMIEKDIINGRGLCVIDLLGNLYPRLLKFLAYYDLAERVVLFDPNDDEHCPGLNYFDTFDGQIEPGAVLDAAMEGILRVYGEQNESAKPRWETYGPLTFMPLIQSKLTMLEIFPFVSPHINILRDRILSQYQEFYVSHGWREFDSKRSESRKFELIEVVYNRGMRFWPDPRIRRIVGQTENFVNWRAAMDEGKVVLCNLGKTAKVTDKQAQMLGVIMLHQIISAAKTRRGDNLRRFYLYIDEFPQILCKDFQTAPDILRNFGVSLILAHQHLAQLKKEVQDINVRSAVMSNVRVKEVFNISQEDAEPIAKEIFGPYIHGEEVKYQGEHTLLVPHQEIIELSSKARSGSWGSFSGDPGYSYSEGVIFDEVPGLGSRYTSGTSQYGPSGGVQDTSGESEGVHESLRTVYEREKEPDTPVFRSVEEKIWEYIRKIMSQQQRESILLIPARKPMSITTPWLKEYYIDDECVEQFTAQVHKANGTLSAHQVDLAIEERYRKLLGNDFGKFWTNLPAQDEFEDESDDERFQ